ncbi:MAG: rhomboid family intramembrane serine protease [Planctomycetes bacterium]|nr:rhomboid family intramembrane serine protease [Planctomycetota bacterium]
MIIPYRTSIRPRRTPYTNYALIAVNALIFLLEYQTHPITGNLEFRPWVHQFMLTAVRPQLWQFVSYAFLHAGFIHIIGNMFFLYLFGNNVNDKLGHIGYLCFYLAGAVFSGIGHTVLHSSSHIPTLGASGAVAAVTGAYLVLFPKTLVTILYWFFFIGTMEVPALYFIAFKMILIDNVIARYTPQVAYDAHLSGYAFGIAAMLAMLAAGLTSTSNFDLWAMIKRGNRRRQYRDAVSSGYDPFTGRAGTKQIKAKSPAEQQKDEKTQELRNEISNRMLERNLPAAAEVYLKLMNHDSEQLLPRQNLLDIANKLAGDNKHTESAQAYEQFLTHYRTYEYAEQVELMLGILYCRYLNQPKQAIKYLEAAAKKLTDPGQLKMCKDELARLQN